MLDSEPIKVAVLGASGYSGSELIRILLNHESRISFVLPLEQSLENLSQMYFLGLEVIISRIHFVLKSLQ